MYLTRLKVVEEQLVNPLLADLEGPLLLLEVLALILSLFGGQLNPFLDLFWVKAIQYLKEKVPLRKPLLVLASWIWEVLSYP